MDIAACDKDVTVFVGCKNGKVSAWDPEEVPRYDPENADFHKAEVRVIKASRTAQFAVSGADDGSLVLWYRAERYSGVIILKYMVLEQKSTVSYGLPLSPEYVERSFDPCTRRFEQKSGSYSGR